MLPDAASRHGLIQALGRMPKSSSPFKNSIWLHDDRYDFDRSSLSTDDYETIRRLGAVDIAKKQVPPVPTRGLLAICEAIKRLPPSQVATARDVLAYLESTLCIHGAGIP